mgnify:FL=1
MDLDIRKNSQKQSFYLPQKYRNVSKTSSSLELDLETLKVRFVLDNFDKSLNYKNGFSDLVE